MTAYLITADASILDDEAASFTRAITETIKFRPGVCWVFQRDQSAVRLTAVGYGEPRSRPASTTQRVVNVTRLERIEEPVDLEDLLAAVEERGRQGFFRWLVEPLERLRSGGVDHTEVLDSGPAAVVRSAIRRLSPDLDGVLERVERGQERMRVGGPAAPIWRLERDAIGLALQAAGIPTAQLEAWEPPNHADKPFSAGLTEPYASYEEGDRHDGELPAAAHSREERGSGDGELRGLSLADLTSPLESSMIDQDARHFPGWDRVTDDIRFDVQTFIGENGRYMEIMSVNAGPAETRTGVDLLYLRRDLQSLVGVQYKLLNKRGYMYPDQGLRGQLQRMRYWTDRFPHKNDSAEDWRLGRDWMYLKLLENGPLYADSARMLPGHYVALGYADVLLTDAAALGPQGGVQLGPRTAHRYLDTGTFVGLLQRAAIGSPLLEDAEIALMFQIALADLHSVITAVDYGP